MVIAFAVPMKNYYILGALIVVLLGLVFLSTPKKVELTPTPTPGPSPEVDKQKEFIDMLYEDCTDTDGVITNCKG